MCCQTFSDVTTTAKSQEALSSVEVVMPEIAEINVSHE